MLELPPPALTQDCAPGSSGAIGGQLQALIRDDGHVAEKSLFEPAITALVDNDFERDFAC